MKDMVRPLCNGIIISTFAAHLTACQRAKTILELKVEGVKLSLPHSYGALVLWSQSELIYLTCSLLILEYPSGSACSWRFDAAWDSLLYELLTWNI